MSLTLAQENYQRAVTAWAAGQISDAQLEAAARAARAGIAAAPKQPARMQRPAPKVPPWLYTKAARRVDQDARLGATARQLLGVLLNLARGRGTCDAYIGQLADLLGKTPRMVQYAQARLEACGYVRIERRRQGRLNCPNLYLLDRSALPVDAPERRRAAPRRRAMGVKEISPHEGSLTGTPPLTPPRGAEDRRGAGRAPSGARHERAGRPSRAGSAGGAAQNSCHIRPP